MIPDDLDTKPLEELDEIFAVEVASWNFHKGNPLEEWVTLHEDWWMSVAECDQRGPASMFKKVHPFSSSADAVLPWLEPFMWVARNTLDCGRFSEHLSVPAENGKHSVKVIHQGVEYVGVAPTFPHAAVLALIRAERTKKGNA